MSRLKLILGLIGAISIWIGNQSAFSDTCLQCHLELDSSPNSPAVLINNDIHYQRGLSCADCHGGDPTVGYKEGDPTLAMDPGKGFRGVPSYDQIPEFCGQCHSDVEYMRKIEPKQRVDQLQLYWTSIHGKNLKLGDNKVAQCVSCHGVHNILPASDTRSPVNQHNVPKTCAKCHSQANYMASYKIPTDQYDKYAQSVHGKLLLERGDKSAPACNSCHGNHGAAPPGLASISAACGECHGLNRDLFNKSPHKKPWEEMGLPECVQCHGQHLVLSPNDEQIGTGKDSYCIQCHSEGEAGYRAAAQIKSSIDSLKMKITRAAEALEQAEKLGVDIDDARFELGEASNGLTEARNKVHSFTPAIVAEVTSASLAKIENVQTVGENRLKGLWHRQLGLLFSSIIILLLASLLFVKMRTLDKKRKNKTQN